MTATPALWAREIALAAATGLVTGMTPVHRWFPLAQRGLHLGVGVVAAGFTAWSVRHPDTVTAGDRGSAEQTSAEEVDMPSALTTAALASTVGLVAISASMGGVAADAAAERALARRGAPRPRLWLGLVASGLSVAMAYTDARVDSMARSRTGRRDVG